MPDGKSRAQSHAVTIRFAGDSGDGMQLSGSQFTDTAAVMGNDFATFPDYPAEIRAPAGTLPGVSSFQIQFADSTIYTPGNLVDVLVAMNPAALRVNVERVKPGGLIIVNEDTFDEGNLRKAAWKSNPLEDTTLKDFQVLRVPISELTQNALKDHPLKLSEVQRCKNFFALGMMFWLYNRSLDYTKSWISQRFGKRPEIAAANVAALQAGFNYADITETMPVQFVVPRAQLQPGVYRKITGNEALAIGLVTAARLAQKPLLYGSYPITPASSILHELSRHKAFGIRTFQAEDEIAAVGAAIGASFGGAIGVCGTSGPGMCLKAEAINLAVMAELPLVVINAQRAGPSTGMPTKTEQADLLQAMFGRNGESPIAVVAPRTPSECFRMAIEAVRIALTFMTPVILLSEGYLAESAEPWRLPDVEGLPAIPVAHPAAGEAPFLPYERDPKTLARPWAVPGTKGLEHRIGGLGKADRTGGVSYDPLNNELMIHLRAEKIRRIAETIPPLEVKGPPSGRLLVLGWGGTFGALYEAVEGAARQGREVAHAHLAYLNPFPKNLGEVLARYESVLVPERNTGQLLMLLRNQFPEIRMKGFHKVQGQPFQVSALLDAIMELA
ncbi:MAG TPA: 2-oxoacid:acceptor oxidoreductase subunit alpha [bacterium]